MVDKNGNKSNIIMISRGKVSNSRFHECGLEYLQANGWNVDIWTVGPVREIENCFDEECRKCKTIHFDTYKKYDLAVKKSKENSVFYFASCDIELILLRPIADYKCDYVVQGNRGETPKTRIKDIYIPEKEGAISFFRDWLHRVSNERLGYIKRKRISFSNWLYCVFNPVIPIEKYMPAVVFTINELSLSRMIEKNGNTWLKSARVVYVPSTPYDYYLEEERKGDQQPEKENFILLIASGLGFEYEGAKKTVYKEAIYSQEINELFLHNLERLLGNMERHYGCPVIVAGHPRGVYNGYDFGGRKVLFGRTPELSKKCRICITTISYAMTFPIIYNKKIVFYYNDSIKKTPLWEQTYLAYMKELKLRGINLDDERAMVEPWKSEEIVDESSRTAFLRNYHCSVPDKRELYGEILEDYIKKTFN